MTYLWDIRREFLVAFRTKAEVINPLAFFVLVTFLFALGAGLASEGHSSTMAIGCIWVVAMFASMLSTESAFRSDYENGTIDLLLMHRQPLFLTVLGRMTCIWLMTGLPLSLMSLWTAWMFNLSSDHWMVLVGTLLLGTPVLTALGILGSAMTLGSKRGGIALALIVMPLYVPVLLIGTGVCHSHTLGFPVQGAVLWMVALFLGTITLVPFVVAKVLQASVEY